MAAGKMIFMTMFDGNAIGVYHVEPNGTRRRRAGADPGSLRHHRKTSSGSVIPMRRKVTKCWRRLFSTARRRGSLRLFARRNAEGRSAGLWRAARPARGRHKKLHRRAEGRGTRVHRRLLLWRLGGVGRCLPLRRADGGVQLLRQAGAGDGGRNTQMPDDLSFRKERHEHPMDGVEKLRAIHPDVPVYVYDAGHGFNSDRPTHRDETSAKLARERTLELFRANGG